MRSGISNITYLLCSLLVFEHVDSFTSTDLRRANQLLRRNSDYKHNLTKGGSKLSLVPIPLDQQQDQQLLSLEFWITSFSLSHIGMSAIRDNLIYNCGKLASEMKLINRGIKLPDYWPGDDFGQDEIFPDSDTAGRQIYRVGYTLVSFTTLGNAFTSYLSIVQSNNENNNNIFMSTMPLTEQEHMVYFSIASLAFATSIASLFNASPLGLMPGFQKASQSKDSSGENKKATVAGLQRNDGLKFEPRGLTRITRHPLILPVVPWGISTSFLAGGLIHDFVLFTGLSIYAIAGCACQDLRILRKEGSVGTVFKPDSEDIGMKLNTFFDNTSFVPFGALLDGRQSIHLMVKEFPYIPFVVGIPIGAVMEDSILQFLKSM